MVGNSLNIVGSFNTLPRSPLMMGLAQQGLEYIPPLILTIFQVYRRGYQFTPFPEALVLLPGGPSPRQSTGPPV